MASILSHPAAALSLVPWFRSAALPPYTWWLGVVCTIVPDFDVIGFWFGIGYRSTFGHRGFTHSLCFAAVFSLLLVAAIRSRTRRSYAWFALFLYLFLCTASHGVLDAMTNGGYGVAFFSPLSNERYFFPWRPIQVSPLQVQQFFSPWGVRILQTELMWVWSQAFVVGLIGYLVQRRARPRPQRALRLR